MAAYTAMAAEANGYRTLTDGSPIMADHVALLENDEHKFTAAGKVATCLLRLVLSLSHLHMHLPADQVLRDLGDIRKQLLCSPSTSSSSGSSSNKGSQVAGDTDGGSSSGSRNHLSVSGASCEGGSSGASLLDASACRPGCDAKGAEDVLALGRELEAPGGAKQGGAAAGDTEDIEAGSAQGVVGPAGVAAEAAAAGGGGRGRGGEAARQTLPTPVTQGTYFAPTDVIWLFTVLPSQQVGPSPSDHPADKPRQGAAAAHRSAPGSPAAVDRAVAGSAAPNIAAAGQGPEISAGTSGEGPEPLARRGEPGEGAGFAAAAAAAAAAAKRDEEGDAAPCAAAVFQTAPISLDQLKLLLELLLCSWPAHKGPVLSFCWELLLLLVGLVQQASVEVRRQLMQQRGVLVLQLLYHVLLDDDAFGGPGVSAPGDFAVMRPGEASSIVDQLSTGSRTGGLPGEQAIKDPVWEQVKDGQYDPFADQLVLLLLRNLMYEPLPMELVKGGRTELMGMYITGTSK